MKKQFKLNFTMDGSTFLSYELDAMPPVPAVGARIFLSDIVNPSSGQTESLYACVREQKYIYREDQIWITLTLDSEGK